MQIKYVWLCHTCGRSGFSLVEPGVTFSAMHAALAHLESLTDGMDCPRADISIVSMETLNVP